MSLRLDHVSEKDGLGGRAEKKGEGKEGQEVGNDVREMRQSRNRVWCVHMEKETLCSLKY